MDLKTLLDTPPWDWPSNAGKMLQNILTDKRTPESDRLVAAELAGDFTVIDDQLCASLLGIIGSAAEPEKLRAQAAISLGPLLEHADMDGLDDPDDVPITGHTFDLIRNSLHNLYLDEGVPKLVRRKVLEAAVRAPQEWHQDAIRAAYASGDRDWMLTAMFSMGWLPGFDDQILQSLESTDPEIHCEAVTAAGNWEIERAWPHVSALVKDTSTRKPLLLAAIEAVANMRPQEARDILGGLAGSDDEEIAEAAEEAIGFAEASLEDTDDKSVSEWIN